MTGNTKIWRAPLAGLASVAMLATMGVAAATANAVVSEEPTGTYQISYIKKNGEKAELVSGGVTVGDSLADAIGGTNLAVKTNDKAYDASGVFIGWYLDGKPVDYFAPITSDITLTPKYVASTEAVTVNFVDDMYGFVPNFDDRAQVKVAKNSGLAKEQLPYDKADSMVPTEWEVSYPDGKTETVTDLTKVDWSRPDSGTINITVSKWDKAKIVEFTGDSSEYALNAYADGDTTDDNLTMDVTSQTAVPTIVTLASGASYTANSKWADAGNNVVSTVPAEEAAYHLTEPITYYFVAFNTGVGGSEVDGQYVAANGFVDKPATDPTREGYTFKGWVTTNGGTNEFDFNTTKITGTGTIVYAAWRANDADAVELEVTFKDAEYKNANEDVTVKVMSDETLESVAPDWTRDGYVLKGFATTSGATATDIDLTTTLAGTLNDNDDATVYAVWAKVTTDIAAAALHYVDASYENLFTEDSWTQYEKDLIAAQAKYDDAKDATVGDISAKASAEVVSDLKAAWSKLQFKTDIDANTVIVHRLRKGSEHFYSADEREIKQLTSTTSTSGDWIDEGVLLYSLNAANDGTYKTLASFDNAITDAAYPETVDTDDVKNELEAAATPIVKAVNRVFNRVNGDHVWTVDANEYDVLTSQVDWSGEDAAFYVPTYNTSRSVYRLSKGNRHLLSTDSNEVEVLSTRDGWTNENVAFNAF